MEKIKPTVDNVAQALSSVEKSTYAEEKETKRRGVPIEEHEKKTREEAGFERHKLREGYENWEPKTIDSIRQKTIDLLPESIRDDDEVKSALEKGLTDEEVLKVVDYEFKTADTKGFEHILRAAELDIYNLKQLISKGHIPFEPVFLGYEDLDEVIENVDSQIDDKYADIGTGINFLSELKKTGDTEELKTTMVGLLVSVAYAFKLESLIAILQSKNI